ncbi:MAG TPA: hypothetical protein VF796_09550 [Humisphaera sp.]
MRDAERRFMHLWRIEQVLIGPDVLDRLAADMAEAHRELEALAAGELADAGSDPDFNPPPSQGYPRPRNWSMYTNGGADGQS